MVFAARPTGDSGLSRLASVVCETAVLLKARPSSITCHTRTLAHMQARTGETLCVVLDLHRASDTVVLARGGGDLQRAEASGSDLTCANAHAATLLRRSSAHPAQWPPQVPVDH